MTAASGTSRIRVYRSTSSGQLGSLVKDVPTGPGATVIESEVTGVTPGSSVWYTFRAVDTFGQEGPSSNQIGPLTIL